MIHTPARLRAEVATIGAVALVAAASTVEDVDQQRRIITGTIVPYGQAGRTNLGQRGLRAGAVRFRQSSEPRVIGLYGHDRERTVSRLIAYENGADRLRGRFQVARTPLGDQLLAEAAEGVRSMLSIELDGCSIDPHSGDIVDGLCEFVAHVPIGAYDGATVDSVAASATQPNPGEHVHRSRFARNFIEVGGGAPPPTPAAPAATPPAATPPPAAPPAAPAATPPAAASLAQLLASAGYTAPPAAPPAQPAPPADLAQLLAGLAQLQAGAHVAPPATGPAMLPGGVGALGNAPQTPAQPPTVNAVEQMARLQAAVFQGGGSPSGELRAALADITNTGLDLFQNPAGAIGEQLWTGAGYTRRFVPLMRPKPLTSWKGTGWRWKTRPKMAAYAGDKAEIPTNTVEVETAEWTATRLAGGWDIDRKFRDFGDTAFWTGFYEAQTESYAELSDAEVEAAIVDYALDLSIAANLPAGYSTTQTTAVAGVLKAAALGTAILEDTPNVRRGPDYIVMNTGDWLSLLDLTNLELPAFLALLKVKPENFMRSSLVAPGAVILGVTQAATFRELGGGSPVRVEALDVARAGVDSAVYGYTATSMDRPGGIVSVPLAGAGA